MEKAEAGPAAAKPLFTTQRTDKWANGITAVAIGFTLFIIYATWRAFENNYYEAGNLLSPFYSPKIYWPWWTDVLHLSPAILILWIPAGFRATCYYYRKAYYRAYFMTPPACGVSGFKGINEKLPYSGETKFPFVFQNLHRYMFYFAVIVLAILWWDALQTLFAHGHFFNFGYFQVSLGTIIYFANVILLSGYTFGCHAFRHLIGGRLDCFSCGEQAKTCLSFWDRVTLLNKDHQVWAWFSLVSVGATDLYTRIVAASASAPDGFRDYLLFHVQSGLGS